MNNGKRVREPEDAVYLDNFHAQKRYLSEVMASSLNGLKVGESMQENGRVSSPMRFDPMESPARTESTNFAREELGAHDSPMSEDSDEGGGYRLTRYSVSPQHISMTLTDQVSSNGTSPVSPQRDHKAVNASCNMLGSSSFVVSSTGAGPGASSVGYIASFPLPCSHVRQRNPDSESRFPPSPSDPVQSADLRRAALLRSVHMRSQPLVIPSFEMSVSNSQAVSHMESSDDSSLTFSKTLTDRRNYTYDSSATDVYSTQSIRNCGRVRSLLLDDCSLNSSISFSQLTSSKQDCQLSGNRNSSAQPHELQKLN